MICLPKPANGTVARAALLTVVPGASTLPGTTHARSISATSNLAAPIKPQLPMICCGVKTRVPDPARPTASKRQVLPQLAGSLTDAGDLPKELTRPLPSTAAHLVSCVSNAGVTATLRSVQPDQIAEFTTRRAPIWAGRTMISPGPVSMPKELSP